jgi:hypothetical protein
MIHIKFKLHFFSKELLSSSQVDVEEVEVRENGGDLVEHA